MKLLVLGASGMLGHKICIELSTKYHILGTIRKEDCPTLIQPFLNSFRIIKNIDVSNFNSIFSVIDENTPDVVVNCIGIVKQLPESYDPIKSITINALFPNQLANLCKEKNIRLIHYSTDCVFSGKIGNYVESDFPDADDLYGRTKYLGEVIGTGCLSLRTSLIGREISGFHGLLEWLLRQEGKEIKGYTKAIFSGLTTSAHARILDEIISTRPKLTGLYHVATVPISKYDLLKQIVHRFNLNITVIPEESVICNRSLNGSKFFEDTGIVIPSWNAMIDQLFIDKTPYRYPNVHE